MKNFALIICLVSTVYLKAQQKEGTIVYEKKTNMHKTVTDEQLRAMIPEFRVDKFILQFSNDVSLYKMLPEEERPDAFSEGRGGTRVVMGVGGDKGDTYKNYTLLKSLQSVEMGSKKFIVEDSIKPMQWKLTDETKTILGHVCHKAIAKQKAAVKVRTMTFNDGNKTTDSSLNKPEAGKEVDVVAWYADDMPVPAGPSAFSGLPGVILQVDVDNQQQVFTAVEIKPTFEKNELKEPTKGKKITKEEYKKMTMEMLQNMGMGTIKM